MTSEKRKKEKNELRVGLQHPKFPHITTQLYIDIEQL